MSHMRRVARRLLHAVASRMPGESKAWGDAMMRELDFVDGDWPAMRWALGCSIALCRHSLDEYTTTRTPDSPKERLYLAASLVFGFSAALTLLLASTATLAILRETTWFVLHANRLDVLLFAVIIPDAISLVGVAASRRSHRRLASTALSAAGTLGVHSILFFIA